MLIFKYLFKDWIRLGSFSNNFKEIHLGLILEAIFFRAIFTSGSISEIESSKTLSYLILIGFIGTSLFVRLYTISINSLRPYPVVALVPTVGTPRSKESFVKSTLIPFLLASSSRFTHITTLLVISIVWSAKFKFLSRQVASRITIVASGLPSLDVLSNNWILSSFSKALTPVDWLVNPI